MSLIPIVVEKSGNIERSYDIYSRLLKDNIVFIGSQIDDSLSNVVIAQLLFLEAEDPKKDISLYINTPGGSVTAGMAIFDTMKLIKNQVSTICIGQASSMGAILLMAGSPEKRFALPNSRVLLHQPLGGFQGPASDILIHAREMERTKSSIIQIIADHTRRDPKKVSVDIDRDKIMTAQEARDYGIIDRVIVNR